MYLDGNQIKEVAGNTITPFETITSFIASPMKRMFYDDNVGFVVKATHQFGNAVKTLGHAEIDFDNGSGWQTLVPEVSSTIQYTAPGVKTLRIKYVFSDGTSMENRAQIELDFTPIVPGQPSNSYFDYLHSTADPNSGISVDMYVDYNCDQDGLRKPLIFIEGYDPGEQSDMQLENDLNRFLGRFQFNLENQSIYFTRLKNEGYDVIYIDYQDGGAAIQDNAAAVRQAILWINEQKALNGSYEKNVIMGSSMGGLVGKYALRSMELANEAHETETLLTIDSPMRGANALLSAQFAARHLANLNWRPFVELGDLIPGLREQEYELNNPAARQMLIEQCDTDVEGGMPSLYDSFMTEFHGMGDLEQTREIAIINGSQTQSSQPVGDREKIFSATLFSLLGPNLTQLLVGNTYLDIDLWTLPDNASSDKTIYRCKFLKFMWGLPINIVFFQGKVAAGTPGYDSAPGGRIDPSAPAVGYNNLVDFVPRLLFLRLGVDLSTLDVESLCFIPSVSGISYDDLSDLDKDISNNLLRVTDGTTHYKNYVGETSVDEDNFYNHYHEDLTERGSKLMRFEMTGINLQLPSSLTDDFNFGSSQRDGVNFLLVNHYRTGNRIVKDLAVSNAGLGVNRNSRIAYVANNIFPTNATGQHYRLHIFDSNCITGVGTSLVFDDAEFNIGDHSVGNTATVNVSNNSTITAQNSSVITVDSGSDMHFREGCSMNVTSNSSLVLEENSLLEFHAGAEFILNNSQIEIKSDATLIVHAQSNFSMNGGSVEIKSGGRLIIEHYGRMDYYGGDIILNGDDAVLKLSGVVGIHNGETFTFTWDDSQYVSGHIEIGADANGWWEDYYFEPMAPGAKIHLEGSDRNDLILDLGEGAGFAFKHPTESYETDRISMKNGRVTMASESRISVTSADCKFYKVDFIGASRGLQVWHQNRFDYCRFEGDGNGIAADMRYSDPHILLINYCDFDQEADIETQGHSYYVRGSNFSNASRGIFSSDLILPSTVTGCSFDNVTWPVRDDYSQTILRVRGSSFTGPAPIYSDAEGLYKSYGQLNLKCNSFDGFGTAVKVENTSQVQAGVMSQGGYNVFENNEVDINLGYYQKSDGDQIKLDINKGYNDFMGSQGANQYIVGSMGSHEGPTGTEGIYYWYANQNYWSDMVSPEVLPGTSVFESYDQIPNPERFAVCLFGGYNGPAAGYGCNSPAIYAIDQEPWVSGVSCGRYDTKPSLKKSNKVDKDDKERPKIEYTASAYGKTLADSSLVDPIIYTASFDSVACSDAIIYAASLMELYNDTTGNNLEAIPLFKEVITYDFDTLAADVQWMLDIAYTNMKTSYEHAFALDSINAEDNQIDFHPRVQDYVDVLMYRSADQVHEANYVTQFYLELDKAQFFRVLGKHELAHQLLLNLDNCPIDSLEQSQLNALIYVTQEYLLVNQAAVGLPLDSLTALIDTSSFTTPSPLDADEFYFGAQIHGVDMVSYTNCDLISWKTLVGSGEKREFFVYPNPTSGVLTIAYEQRKDELLTFELRDLHGRLIGSYPMKGKEGMAQVDISDFPDGAYPYTIMSSTELLESGQVVKQR